MDHGRSHRETSNSDIPSPDRPVFSLTCQECDAGQGVASMEEAVAAGWLDIVPAGGLIEANYCGLCPTCRANRHECSGTAESSDLG